jgi:hypothetical protein
MATYKPIQSFTTTGNESVVTFSNIPQDYTDLVIVSNVVWTSDAYINNMRFNGDAGSNYSYTRITGNGTSATSSRLGNINYAFGGWTGVNPTLNTVHIMNYSNSTKYKTSLVRTNLVADRVVAYVNMWRNTAAITSITLTHESASAYSAGSTFSLYGIKSGSQKAFGGDVTTTDGTYWYHTFNTSGLFTVQQGSNLSVDYLVVAGGGAGGYDCGGGGGAGGYKYSTGFSCSGGSANTVIVGAGGARGLNRGQSGSNSVFDSITSTGGGSGGGRITGFVAGDNGGSGGGGGGDNLGAGGSASPAGQGNAGGRGLGGTTPGGGGGGAGAAGTNTTGESAPGNGGNGLTNSISGTSVTYAGGGGGGYNAGNNGGTGGGGYGAGASSVNNGRAAQAGTANTGGGGGGGSNGTAAPAIGGQGGSGIVIVRYSV